MPRTPGPLTLLARSRRLRRWAIATPVLLVLYVASLGPLNWWAYHGMPPEIAVVLRAYFAPAVLAEEHGPKPISKALDWYLGLWL